MHNMPLEIQKEEAKPGQGSRKKGSPIACANFIIPLVCHFLDSSEQVPLSLACNEFGLVLRDRPDVERTVQLGEFYEKRALKSQLPVFCLVPNVTAIKQYFFRSAKSNKESGRRPLWLLGGFPVTFTAELNRACTLKSYFAPTLTTLDITKASFNLAILDYFPLLTTLNLELCTIRYASLKPLEGSRVKRLTCKKTECFQDSHDNIKNPCALFKLFSKTLEVADLDGTISNPRFATFPLNVSMLNHAKRLVELKLASFTMHNPGEAGNMDNNPITPIELPLLQTLTLSGLEGGPVSMLRGCRALETVSFKVSHENAAVPTSRDPDFKDWYLCDLRKLRKMNLSFHRWVPSETTDHQDDEISLECARATDGRLMHLYVERLRCAGSQMRIPNGVVQFTPENFQWVYGLGFVRTEVEITIGGLEQLLPWTSMYSRTLPHILNVSPKLVDLSVDMGREGRESGDMRRPYDAYETRPVPDTVAPLYSSYACKNLQINWREGDLWTLDPYFFRMKLKRVCLTVSAAVKERETYEFDWLQNSISTLEELKVATHEVVVRPRVLWPKYWKESHICPRLNVSILRALRSLSFEAQRLKLEHLLEIGSLPLLSKLSLIAVYLDPSERSPEETYPRARADFFPALEELHLVDISMSKQCSYNGFFRNLILEKEIRTFALVGVRPTCFAKDRIIMKARQVNDGIGVQHCVNLDFSGCLELNSLQYIYAPVLKRLVVNDCPNLMSVKGITRCPMLEVFSARACCKLDSLRALAGLLHLQVVLLDGSTGLKTIHFDFVQHCLALKFLNIIGCRNVNLTKVAKLIRVKPYHTVMHTDREVPGAPKHVRVFYFDKVMYQQIASVPHPNRAFEIANNSCEDLERLNTMSDVFFNQKKAKQDGQYYIPTTASFGKHQLGAEMISAREQERTLAAAMNFMLMQDTMPPPETPNEALLMHGALVSAYASRLQGNPYFEAMNVFGQNTGREYGDDHYNDYGYDDDLYDAYDDFEDVPY